MVGVAWYGVDHVMAEEEKGVTHAVEVVAQHASTTEREWFKRATGAVSTFYSTRLQVDS